MRGFSRFDFQNIPAPTFVTVNKWGSSAKSEFLIYITFWKMGLIMDKQEIDSTVIL